MCALTNIIKYIFGRIYKCACLKGQLVLKTAWLKQRSRMHSGTRTKFSPVCKPSLTSMDVQNMSEAVKQFTCEP
ncbi:hypothetical protein X975_11432, partial [Stegodyphus mimosarum]